MKTGLIKTVGLPVLLGVVLGLGLVSALDAYIAHAQEKPRHIDFTKQLVGLDGKSINNGDTKAPVPLTLGDATVAALYASLDEDRQATGSTKFHFDELAHKIYKKSDVVLSVEDLALIKDRIGKAYGPLVVGAAWRLIDPTESENGKGSK